MQWFSRTRLVCLQWDQIYWYWVIDILGSELISPKMSTSSAGVQHFQLNSENDANQTPKWRWCLLAICRFGSCFQLLPVRQTSTFLSFSSTNGGGDCLVENCQAYPARWRKSRFSLLWHASVSETSTASTLPSLTICWHITEQHFSWVIGLVFHLLINSCECVSVCAFNVDRLG